MYQEADRQLQAIQNDLKREAVKLDNTGIDELHTASVKTITTRLMKRLLKRNKKAYWVIARKAFADAINEARKHGFKKDCDDLQESWMLGLLDDYNYVTGYLYYPEAERKRLRLSEAINTALNFNDRELYHKEVKRFFNLWWTQTKQYAIDVVDGAETEAWQRLGVEYAMWVTAQDEKVCEECGLLDGEIFKLDDFPPKPHYNCRCRKIPMPKNYKPKDN